MCCGARGSAAGYVSALGWGLGNERQVAVTVVTFEARRGSEPLRVPPTAGGTTKAPVEVRMRFLEVADDLEVDALDLREVDLLDVDQTQELAHRARHLEALLEGRGAAQHAG